MSVGWGANKSIQTLTMAIEGFKFIALPTVKHVRFHASKQHVLKFLVISKVFNFADDVPEDSNKHGAPPDPVMMESAFTELGHRHGCDKCTIWNCVDNCKSFFDGKSSPNPSSRVEPKVPNRLCVSSNDCV